MHAHETHRRHRPAAVPRGFHHSFVSGLDMKSIGAMIKQIAALEVGDLTEWEDNFCLDMYLKTRQGKETSVLTDKQVEKIESIFNKHFAG